MKHPTNCGCDWCEDRADFYAQQERAAIRKGFATVEDKTLTPRQKWINRQRRAGK